MAGYTLLTVERGVEGDANLDGVVDEADAAVLCQYWQSTSEEIWNMGWDKGDFNGDGAVNDIDATLLAANWQLGTTAAGQSIPEPSAVCGLLALGLAVLLGWRRPER